MKAIDKILNHKVNLKFRFSAGGGSTRFLTTFEKPKEQRGICATVSLIPSSFPGKTKSLRKKEFLERFRYGRKSEKGGLKLRRKEGSHETEIWGRVKESFNEGGHRFFESGKE